MSEAQRDKQIKEAEDLLFSGPQRPSFAKGLFSGQFITDAAMELFAFACVISRWDAELQDPDQADPARRAQHLAAAYALKASAYRVRRHLAEMRDNVDQAMTEAADAALRHDYR